MFSTNLHEVCFIYNRCYKYACGLNKSNQSGDETKSFPFLNTPIIDFLHVFPYRNYSYLL